MIIILSIIIFWVASIFVVYTYAVYPLYIAFLARKCQLQTAPQPDLWPSIALIIPVYNEADNINKKLKNLQELDYPKDKVNITFISDGSSDKTEEILAAVPWVTLLIQKERKGKPAALNVGVAKQEAEVLVFTDARQSIAKDAIKKLVSRLLQPNIGAVSGELVHYDSLSATAQNVGLYWRYEKWIRGNESMYASVPGVTGALYVIRRKDFSEIPEDTLLDDFEIPLKVLKQNKRILFETDATIFDYVQEKISNEQTRKIRTLTGNFQSFSRNKWLFSPSQNPIFLQFISHKFFRLLVPYALILSFISSAFIPHWFYQLAFIGQFLFYALALCGHYSETACRNKVISFSNVFLFLNIAAVVAYFNFLKSPVNVKWDKTS